MPDDISENPPTEGTGAQCGPSLGVRGLCSRTFATHPWVPRAALAVLSGFLLAGAFPPLDWGALSWIALVPVFGVLRKATWRAGACYGALTGLTFFLLLFTYINAYGFLAWFALSAWEATFFAFAGALIAIVGGRVGAAGWPWATAGLWTLTNLLRGNVGPLSLPFGELAYAQHAASLVRQLAALLGMYGVTLLVALVNAALANLTAIVFGALAADHVRREALRPEVESATRAARWVALTVAAALGWGAIWLTSRTRPESAVGEALTVAAVQGNLSAPRGSIAAIEQSLSTYRQLSETLAGRDLDIVVWPEGSVPGRLEAIPSVLPRLQQTARDLDAWFLFGAQRRDSDGHTRNSAVLLSPEGDEVAQYDKNNLVMFGEYVPFRRILGWVQRYGAPRFDLAPGRGRRLLPAGTARLGCAICFESLFPDVSRELVREGAEVLVIITSDGWAGQTAEVRQHGYVAQIRAVETGRYVVRAGDTGLTCIITPWGSITRSVPPFRPTVLVGKVRCIRAATPYVRWGDAVILVLCHAGFLVPVWTHRRRRRRLAQRRAQ